MNARVYLNTSSLQWSERIDGGAFAPPTLRGYSDLLIKFRLARDVEGTPVPDDREVASVNCRIGRQDSPPESGTYKLDLTVGSDTVTTAAIAYNATAAALKSALDTALTGGPLAALQPVTVALEDDAYRITFADADETVTLSAAENKLWPLSFVNADRFAYDGGWSTMLTLRQAPVAEASVVTEVVPEPPTITQIQAGSTVDDVEINEVQKIALSADYAGATMRIVRDGVKSDLLPGFPTVEQLQAALDLLADEGGTFFLVPVEDGVLIEFRGEMGGTDQTLLTVEEFTPPPVEYLVELPTRTAAMGVLLRGMEDEEIELPLDLVVVITDPDAPSGTQTIPFPLDLTFTKPVSDDSYNVAETLDWSQPLSRRSNEKFSTNAVLVGNRAVQKVIGDGSATSFVITHNLGAATITFTADASTDVCTATAHNLHNGDPVTLTSSGTLPAGLSTGVTYWVINATTNTFKLSATPNGSAVNITGAGTGTHTLDVADGTTDAVFVEVWENSGLQRRVSPEDYTVARTSATAVTVSGFASTPTSEQYVVIVQTAGRPATYQQHNHTITEVTGLRTELDALEARIAALEALTPGKLQGTSVSAGSGTTIARALAPVWSIVRTRPGTLLPEVPLTLLGWSPYTVESPMRPSRLLPAVHDASTESLPAAPLPAPADAYKNRVFTTSADRTDFPGGLKAGDFAACDGREWYRVIRESVSESSYYPAPFELELFRTAVNDRELVLGSTLNVAFGFEAALFIAARNPRDRRSACTWTLKLEIGTQTADSSPGTPGSNLDTFFSSPAIVLEQKLHLTELPSQHRFGMRVTRDAEGTIVVTPVAYRKELATVTPPGSANFAIRARLCRFDTEDTPIDARGLIALRGLNVGLDGQEDPDLGKLTII